MRKIVFGCVTLLILAALARAGGDPWKSKPFQQWTESDITTIFQSSPWAKSNVQPMGAWQPMGSQTTSGVGVMNEGGNGGGTHIDGGASLERDAIARAQHYNVLWWSSRTIRAASLRRAVLHGTMSEADAENALAQPAGDYEILVTSNNMTIFEKRGEKAFERVATLEVKKSRHKIAPSRVEFQLGSGDNVIGAIFHFPKKDPSGGPYIAPEEKEVEFFLQVGDAKILTSFDLRKMVDSRGEDL